MSLPGLLLLYDPINRAKKEIQGTVFTWFSSTNFNITDKKCKKARATDEMVEETYSAFKNVDNKVNF